MRHAALPMIVEESVADEVAPSPGMGTWVGDGVYRAGDAEFTVTADPEIYLNRESTAERFILAKTRDMVDRLARLIEETRPRRIVELGIFKGGSAALITSLACPERLTAVELASEPVPALEEFLTSAGLRDRVRTHYGVDQADRDAMSTLLESDHGAEPLDLVVDDASHLYRETRTSFELLFPRLRPGGRYVIEDWGWAHFPGPLWQERGGYFHDRPALTNLLVEILMVAAGGEDVVAGIDVLRDTATIRRGPAEITGPLELERHYVNRGQDFRPLL